MTELKTLKDIVYYPAQEIGIAQEGELKREAIKWVKLFGENMNVKHYFTEFFNLTEDDLK